MLIPGKGKNVETDENPSPRLLGELGVPFSTFKYVYAHSTYTFEGLKRQQCVNQICLTQCCLLLSIVHDCVLGNKTSSQTHSDGGLELEACLGGNQSGLTCFQHVLVE
jgi:hypothetical protein